MSEDKIDPIQRECRKLIHSDKAEALSDADFLLVAGLAESDDEVEPSAAMLTKMSQRFAKEIATDSKVELRKRPDRGLVKAFLALAATLLLGFFLGRYVWPEGDLTFSNNDLQLAALDTTLKDGNRGKAVVIESPIDGFATVVLVGTGEMDSQPRANGDEYRVVPGTETRVAFRPDDYSRAHVFITQTGGAHEIVRRFIRQHSPKVDELPEAIAAELRDKGHDWVLVNSVDLR